MRRGEKALSEESLTPTNRAQETVLSAWHYGDGMPWQPDCKLHYLWRQIMPWQPDWATLPMKTNCHGNQTELYYLWRQTIPWQPDYELHYQWGHMMPWQLDCELHYLWRQATPWQLLPSKISSLSCVLPCLLPVMCSCLLCKLPGCLWHRPPLPVVPVCCVLVLAESGAVTQWVAGSTQMAGACLCHPSLATATWGYATHMRMGAHTLVIITIIAVLNMYPAS